MDKGKAIESALLQIEKKFGKGSIMRLGEKPVQDVAAISTNCSSVPIDMLAPVSRVGGYGSMKP